MTIVLTIQMCLFIHEYIVNLPLQTTHENCFYQGTVAGAENSDVSLSTCDGIE